MHEDLSLPIAIISKIIRDALPEGSIIHKDAKPLFSQAASMFVMYLTSTAVSIAKTRNRKTICAEDVLRAVAEIELEEHLGTLREELDNYRVSLNYASNVLNKSTDVDDSDQD